MSTSPSNFNFLDQRIVACFAFLPLLSINLQKVLILTGLMIAAERPESRSFILDCAIDDRLSIGHNGLNLLGSKFGDVLFRMHPGSEEDFVSVDVADPANKFLIQDDHFCHPLFSVNDILEVLEIEVVGVIDLGSKLGDGLVLELFASLDHDHSPEFPDVGVNEFRAIIHDELNVVVLAPFERGVFRIKGVLPLHSQMGNDGVLVELENQVLSIPVNFLEGLVDEAVDEYFGFVRLDHGRVVYFDVLDFFLVGEEEGGG